MVAKCVFVGIQSASGGCGFDHGHGSDPSEAQLLEETDGCLVFSFDLHEGQVAALHHSPHQVSGHVIGVAPTPVLLDGVQAIHAVVTDYPRH